MNKIFIEFKFILSPIVWCKKAMNYEFSNRANFWFKNDNCEIYENITTENIRKICPFVMHAVAKYKNSNIEVIETKGGDEVPSGKNISIAVRSFVKEFQWINKNWNKTYARTQRARNELSDICWKCKNSKQI